MSGLRVIVPLGTAQTIAWASSYYLPAILAVPIAADFGVSPTFLFGALSGALVISGLLGPRVGHAIDLFGGRGLLSLSNVAFAAGLAVLSIAQGAAGLVVSWVLLGVGMGLGLYEAAFASLARLYGARARQSITGITLIAGFASTVGWPVTAFLDQHYGWRAACMVWAAVHILIALPLNLSLPPAAAQERPTESIAAANDGKSKTWTMIAIAYVFAATGFVSSGLSALLPTLLVQLGATASAAVFSAALVGPAQVLARIVEAGLLSRYHPLASTRLATLMHPLGVVAITMGGPLLAPVFALLYGAGNGILTIARGTLPLAIFGPVGYGKRVGWIAMPARVTGAAAPLALSFLFETFGTSALWVSALMSLSALAVLLALQARRATIRE